MTDNTPTYTALDVVEETLDLLRERIPQVPKSDPHYGVFEPMLLTLGETIASLRGDA